MTPAQWERVKALFERLANTSGDSRAALLSSESDPEVAAEALRLVERHDASAPILDRLRPDPASVRADCWLTRFRPGQLLAGRFRIVRFLASGGMGEVYEAEDRTLEERVALKTVHRDLASHPVVPERFRHEIQLARKISHPNVCRVHDVWRHAGAEGSVDFLTMELVEGETLAARIRKSGPVPPPELEDIVRQLADGLSAAHDSGIVHRDFKSSNVILAPRPGGGYRAVITDFGLSRQIEGDTMLTGSGATVGTPAYMAPEQIEGKNSGPAMDIYAFGVVIYEMVTGVLPFSASSPMAIALQKARDTPLPPSARLPGIEPKWDRIMARCLVPDPAARFARASDVALAVSSGKIAAVPSRRGRWWPWWGLAAAVLALTAALAMWRGPSSSPANPEAARRYREGVAAQREGATFRANKLLALAVQLDPDHAPARARLAETWLDLDYSDRAKDELMHAAAAVSKRRLSRQDAGAVDASRATVLGELDRAEAAYRKLAQAASQSERAGAWIDLGRSQERNDRPAEARATFAEALRIDARQAAASLRLGVLDGRGGRIEESLRHFRQAAGIYESTADYEGQAEVLLRRGAALIQADKLPDARRNLESALERARANGNIPQQIEAMTQLAVATHHSGDLDGARRQVEQPVKLALANGLESLAARSLIDLGNTFLAQYQLKEAEERFTEALEMANRFKLRDSHARASLSLASTAARRNDPERALALARPAVDYFATAGYKRNHALGLTLIAQALGQTGDFRGVAELADRQLAGPLAPSGSDRAAWLETRATARTMLGQFPRALEDYREASRLQREAGRAQNEVYDLLNEASVLSQMGKAQDAAKVLSVVEGRSVALDSGVKSRWLIVSAQHAHRQRQAGRVIALAREALKQKGNSELRVKEIEGLLCAAGSRPGAIAAECDAVEKFVSAGAGKRRYEVRYELAEGVLAAGERSKAVSVARDLASDAAAIGAADLHYRAAILAGDDAAAAESQLRESLGPEVFTQYRRRPDLAARIHVP